MAEWRKITQEELSQVLAEHKKWIDSDGKEGAQADLSSCDLKDANLQDANLQGTNLQGANLQDARFWAANLQGANFSGAILNGANLLDAELQNAGFMGANLGDAYLEGANLKQAFLRDANLRGAYCEGADFSWAILQEANLCECKLQRAILCGVNLSLSSLALADLSGADLSGANIDHANVSGWTITGIKCSHIIKNGLRVDYGPGEFETAFTQVGQVAEIIISAPYSDFSHYVGLLIQNATNERYKKGAVLFAGQKVLTNDTTLQQFIVFSDEACQNIIKEIQKIPTIIAQSIREEKAEKGIVGLKGEMSLAELMIPISSIVIRPHKIGEALTERYNTMAPLLQKIFHAIQGAIQ